MPCGKVLLETVHIIFHPFNTCVLVYLLFECFRTEMLLTSWRNKRRQVESDPLSLNDAGVANWGN